MVFELYSWECDVNPLSWNTAKGSAETEVLGQPHHR